MALEKIRLRNSGATATSLVIGILLAMGIFYGLYQYVATNTTSANITLSEEYAQAFGNLTKAQEDLNESVSAIKVNADSIAEAENTFQVAWNGLKGLGNTFKLFLSFVNTTLKTWASMLVFLMGSIPGWALSLIFIGLFSFVLFLVLRILKGEPSL